MSPALLARVLVYVYLFWKTFQDSSHHRTLVFAPSNTTGQLWAALIFPPLRPGSRVEPESGTGTLSSPTLSPSSTCGSPHHPGRICHPDEFTRVPFSWIMMSPENRLLLQRRQLDCIAAQVHRGRGKKCKRKCGLTWGKHDPENPFHLSYPSFLCSLLC